MEPTAITDGAEVLVVDRDAATRDQLNRAFTRCGIMCTEAVDGESALRLGGPSARDGAAHLSAAVIKFVLPGMSGPELAWRLHEAHPGIWIVGVSGDLDLWDMNDLHDLGICEAMPEPVDAGEIVRSVAEALSCRRERKV